MKLLCVVPAYWPAFSLGGPIFSVHAMNRQLVKKGIDVTVYTTCAGQDEKCVVNQQVDIDAVKVTYFTFFKVLEFLGESGFQFSPALSRALDQTVKNFDMVYIVAVWNYPVLAAAYYCRKYAKPYILSPRGLLYPYTAGKKSWKKQPYWLLAVRRAVNQAALIHYTTEDEALKTHPALRLTNKWAVVACGVEPDNLAGGIKEDFIGQYPGLRNKKIILFLGRINWKKGLDILLKAFSILAKKRDDVRLCIAGKSDTTYQQKVYNIIRDTGIADKVIFTGMLDVSAKSDAYAAADIFVLPSYSENFGVAVAEAMSCGVPVIISDQVGIQKDVAASGAGMVIRTDEHSLLEAMEKLLQGSQIGKEMGCRGRQLVREKYSLDMTADGMIRMFRDLLNE